MGEGERENRGGREEGRGQGQRQGGKTMKRVNELRKNEEKRRKGEEETCDCCVWHHTPPPPLSAHTPLPQTPSPDSLQGPVYTYTQIQKV